MILTPDIDCVHAKTPHLSVHPNILRLARTLREGRAMLMVEVVQFFWFQGIQRVP